MKVLIVIDVQEDFVNGILGSKEAREIIPYIIKQTHCNDYDFVGFTQDYHSPFLYDETEHLYIERQRVAPHCIFDTEGVEFISDIFPKRTPYFIVQKQTFLCPKLEDELLDRVLWNHNPLEEIHIVGLCTDICVISNALALRSWFPSSRIIVHANGCAGTTPEKHLAALEVMKSNLIEVKY